MFRHFQIVILKPVSRNKRHEGKKEKKSSVCSVYQFWLAAYVDSNSEDSDSDLSDVGEVDSDVEREKQVRYERHLYREDAAQIKKFRQQEMRPGEKRNLGPDDGLKLEHVHG